MHISDQGSNKLDAKSKKVDFHGLWGGCVIGSQVHNFIGFSIKGI